jgi:Fe-Mn family superoxide dismutase
MTNTLLESFQNEWSFQMTIETFQLPYERNALASKGISEETINFHYGKHHATYLTRLNDAIAKTESLQGKSLEELVKTTTGPVFNNAAQVWNHNFYWNSLSPNGGGEPTGALADAINQAFGSFEAFKEKFSAAAAGQFGSGWAWLVKDANGALSIRTTGNAETPLTDASVTSLLTCDVWEHAYYVDFRNDRVAYIKAWWNLVNWSFASQNYQG